jgi:isopentenyl-diphosphate delta-isomerase
MPDEYVILVDEQDNEIGQLEKMEAHRLGLLHRAFSIILFNHKGEMLLQQRAAHKYHSPLLWTNTCCSHQRPGESCLGAAQRRLIEEMGMEAVRKITIKNFPAFIITDDKGNDFFENI